MEFLGVGINERFAPPIQISVVSVNDWQKRGVDNELEANQTQVSSMILLTHYDQASQNRIQQVKEELKQQNPCAQIKLIEDFQYDNFFSLESCQNSPTKYGSPKKHIGLPVLLTYLIL